MQNLQMNQKTERTVSIVFKVALATSFLSILFFLLLSQSTNASLVTWSYYVILYANLVVFFPVLGISLITLSVFYFRSDGFQRAAEKTSLRILTLLLAALIIYLGFKEIGDRKNDLKVVFKNQTSKTISHIQLFGRGGFTELDTLAPYGHSIVIFRGKAILRNIENEYENEASLVYYSDDMYHRYPILKDGSRWNELNGPFQIDFYGTDSVEFSYLPVGNH